MAASSRSCSDWFNGRDFDLSKARLAHGTTFATLYSLVEHRDEHCLIPAGELLAQNKVWFAGEGFRGIADDGVNQKYTSWVRMGDLSVAIQYATDPQFFFDPEKLQNHFREIIEDNELIRAGQMTKGGRDYNLLSQNYPPFGKETHSAYWNRLRLQVRRLKSWDSELYQREFAPKMKVWIADVIRYFDQKQSHVLEKEEKKPVLDTMRMIQREILEPPATVLRPKDREALQCTWPIVFLSSRLEAIAASFSREECVAKHMELGRDIQWIATNEEGTEPVRKLLERKNLASRVQVISIDTLRQMSEQLKAS